MILYTRPVYKNGDTRTTRRFAYLPVSIVTGNIETVVWWEWLLQTDEFLCLSASHGGWEFRSIRREKAS